MLRNKENPSENSELRIKGLLVEKGVRISEKTSVNELSSRGYGVPENEELMLAFYEALYLVEKGILAVEDKRRGEKDLQEILRCYKEVDDIDAYLLADPTIDKELYKKWEKKVFG